MDPRPESPPPDALPRRSRLAVAALLVATLGFCIPVVPALVALVLALVALRRGARTAAILAIAVANLHLALVLVVAALVPLVIRSTAAFGRSQTQRDAESRLERAFTDGERDGPLGIDPAMDHWGTPYRIETVEVRRGRRAEREVSLFSAGPDRRFDTDDDFLAARRSERR